MRYIYAEFKYLKESFLLFSLFSFLESFSLVPLVVPLLSDGPVHFTLFGAVEQGGSDGLDSLDEFGKGVDCGVRVDVLVLLGSVVEDACFGLGDWSLLVLGEQHETVQVLEQSLPVSFESFLRLVLASVVDGNADRSCELDSQTCCFDFLQGESSAVSLPVVISDGCAVDQGSQIIDGPWCSGCGFGSPGLESSLLSGSLVEPDFDVGLPVFSQMHVGEHVVVFNHLSQK